MGKDKKRTKDKKKKERKEKKQKVRRRNSTDDGDSDDSASVASPPASPAIHTAPVVKSADYASMVFLVLYTCLSVRTGPVFTRETCDLNMQGKQRWLDQSCRHIWPNGGKTQVRLLDQSCRHICPNGGRKQRLLDQSFRPHSQRSGNMAMM
jgi:hypothetical protein